MSTCQYARSSVIPDSYFDSFHTAKYRSENPVQRFLIRRFIEKLAGLVVVRLSGRRRLPLKCISPTYLMGMGHLGSPAALEPLHRPV